MTENARDAAIASHGTYPAISDMTVRKCVTGDEAALSFVGQATFLETFAGLLNGGDIIAHCATEHAVELYRRWLATASNRLWLGELEPGAAPIGYLVLAPASLPLPDLGPGDLEVKRIYLLHRFQGRGLGQRLLRQALGPPSSSVREECFWASTQRITKR